MSRLDQRIRLKTRRATPSRRPPISVRFRSPKSHLVPFVDLKAQYRTVRRAVQAGIRRVLESQQFFEGPFVEELEKRIASIAGARYGIGCASGTDALLLALRAAGIGKGDEVAVPAFSFVSTASAVVLAGAKPVFVDIDPQTFNMDPSALESALSPRLRGVVVVHLFGRIAEIKRIRSWCERHHALLVEDAAQALGARYGGQKAGSVGVASCFSFFPTKNLGAYGDAGMVTTSDDKLADTLRVLRTHGQTDEYVHSVLGYNSRLDALQAAVLLAKLGHLERWNRRRHQLARRYTQRFARKGLGQPGSGLVAPDNDKTGRWIAQQYVVRIEKDRDIVRGRLGRRGIRSAVYYPKPLHHQPALQQYGRIAGTLRESELASEQVLALPIYPELSYKQQDVVILALSELILGAEV